MKKTKKLDMWTVLSFVILLCYAVFLLYPMLNLLRQSVVTIDGAFTLEYFQKFFGKSYYLITLWNSFKVSIAVTIITLIIGVPLAYLYNMYEIKGKGLLQIIIILCSMSAPFIGAYSWILMLATPASSARPSSRCWASPCQASTASTASCWCFRCSCSRWCSCTFQVP